MANTSTRIAALRAHEAQLQARISKLENQEKKQARKDDTRLKILVGAALLADAARHSETMALLRAVLVRGVTADRDREFLKARSLL